MSGSKTLLALALAAAAAFFLPAAVAQPDGTHLTVTSGTWVCNAPIQDLAVDGMPLTVTTRIPNGADRLNGDVRLHAGCTAGEAAGDGEPDLILEIEGNGGNVGSDGDALVVVGAHDIDIGGSMDCGAPAGGAHQDGMQVTQGGHRLTFLGFDSGDWDAQTATCHGAGGVFYLSPLGDDPADLTDVVCVGCRMVGSVPGGGAHGTALFIVGSTSSGAVDSCFSANRPIVVDARAVSPVNEGNLAIDRDAGGTQPSPSDCKAGESEEPPPPTTTEEEPPPPTTTAEEPPPETCDEACIGAYEERIATLTDGIVLATTERDLARAELALCQRKLAEANAYFHGRPGDGTLEWAFKMHAVGHRAYGCTGGGR